MDSNARIKFIKSLENLPLQTLVEIHKQLNLCSLVLVSLLSKNWEKVVKSRRIDMESVWEITISRNVLMIYLKFDNKRNNMQIGFKEDQDSNDDFHFEHDQRGNWLTFFYKTAHQLEESSFKALQLLSYLFPPFRYHRITVPLGPRCPDFPFRFLSKLPRAPAKYVDLQADLEVECGDLVKFLNTVVITKEDRESANENRLHIGVRIKNVVPCDEISLRTRNLKIIDDRFLTHISIQKIDVTNAEIGANNFTSNDFNAFFRAWQAKDFERRYRPDKVTFNIRKDQKVKMEEVMKGLGAHVGKPRIRDRWKIEYDTPYPGLVDITAIDLEKGWDIKDSQNFIGTVLLEPNRLTFFRLTFPFHRMEIMDSIKESMKGYQRDFRYSKWCLVQLERGIAAQGVDADAADLKEVVRVTEWREFSRNALEQCRDALEKIKLWKNV